MSYDNEQFIPSHRHGTMIEPIKCATLCPSCGCCEHTPASHPCRCPDCSCVNIG